MGYLVFRQTQIAINGDWTDTWLVVSTYPSEKKNSRQLGLLSPTEWKNKVHVPNHQPDTIDTMLGISRDTTGQSLPEVTSQSNNHQHFLGGGCICSFQHNGKSRKQKKCMGMAHKWSVFRVNGGSCWCVFVLEHPLYSAIILTHSHICRSHWFPSFPGWFQTIIIKPPGPQMLAS